MNLSTLQQQKLALAAELQHTKKLIRVSQAVQVYALYFTPPSLHFISLRLLTLYLLFSIPLSHPLRLVEYVCLTPDPLIARSYQIPPNTRSLQLPRLSSIISCCYCLYLSITSFYLLLSILSFVVLLKVCIYHGG